MTTTVTATQAVQSVAITGVTGMVGTELSRLLNENGNKVLGISRQKSPSNDNVIQWSPKEGLADPSQLESVDTIVHLAGENIAGGRWNAALKKRLRDSRVEGTRSLVRSIAAVSNRPSTLICASAIGYYGDRGSELLSEDAGPGSGFLPDLCRDWEHEANQAAELGLRVVNVRIGIVLSPKGGALAKMLLPFKLGLGGDVGPGDQYWSWIGLHDLTRVIDFCIRNESIHGPVNAVAPSAPTNHEFTKAVGRVLHRPTILPMPAFAAKLALGEMADALLLASARVVPQKLTEAGFQFDHPTLESCLEHELQHR